MPEYRMFRIRVEDHKKLKELAARRDESMLDVFSDLVSKEETSKYDWRSKAVEDCNEYGIEVAAVMLCSNIPGLSYRCAERAVKSLTKKVL